VTLSEVKREMKGKTNFDELFSWYEDQKKNLSAVSVSYVVFTLRNIDQSKAYTHIQEKSFMRDAVETFSTPLF